MVNKSNSKYAWVVAASENYLPMLVALFNSMEEQGHKEDVILGSFRLPENFLKRIQEVYSFKFRIVDTEGENQTLQTAIERFRIAAEFGKEYEAICLLDADMFLLANCGLFFDVAGKGFVITGSNGMLVDINRAYQEQFGLSLGVDSYIYDKIHTTVPIFLGRDDLDWFDEFYKLRQTQPGLDDVFGLNAMGIKMEKDKRMLSFSPMKFTGIHCFLLKPVTGCLEKRGILYSGTEERIFSVHGKFHDQPWVRDFEIVFKRYLKDEAFGERQWEQIMRSRELLLNAFLKLAYQGKLNLKEFVKIEWLEEKLKENLGD